MNCVSSIVQVSVTQKDIDRGVGRECSACPVSWALSRVLKDHLYAYVCPYVAIVDYDRIGIFIRSNYDTTNRLNYRIECPQSVTEFAMDFDDWYDCQCCGCDEERDDFRQARGWEDDEIPAEPWTFDFELLVPTEYVA